MPSLSPQFGNAYPANHIVFIHAVEEAAFPAVLAGRRNNVPVVYDMQSCLPEQLLDYPLLRGDFVQKGLYGCERWLIKRTGLVVCSVGLERHVQHVQSTSPVLEWYFPSKHIEVEADEVKKIRAELQIDSQAQVAMYTGNFQPYQELDRFMEAAQQILSVLPHTVFVLVGGNESERRAFRTESKSLVTKGSFKLLPPKPRSEISKFLALADILVSPRAKVGNLPLKIFDYLAAGRPIVTMDSPTMRKVLQDDRAVLVNPMTNQLGEAIIQLLQDPERMKRLSKAARGYADEHLGWQAFKGLISEIFAHVDRLKGDPAPLFPGNKSNA